MNGLPAFLRSRPDGTSVQIKVVPRASRNEIGEMSGDRLKIKIAAPPVDSAANDELTGFLARRLGVPRASVQITHGRTSRNKTVFVQGAAAEVVAARLLAGK